MSRLVSAVGMSSDATQQQATTAAVARLRPSWPARSFSQTDAQMAPRIRPGSTNGTSRLLAHGWSGETAGRNSTVTITHREIRADRSGRPPPRERLGGFLPFRRGARAAAGKDRQAERAEQHRGCAEVPDHPVQAVLVVLLAPVDGQARELLQLGP